MLKPPSSLASVTKSSLSYPIYRFLLPLPFGRETLLVKRRKVDASSLKDIIFQPAIYGLFHHKDGTHKVFSIGL